MWNHYLVWGCWGSLAGSSWLKSHPQHFHKGWNHLHTGLGEPLRICLNNHGPFPDVNFISRCYIRGFRPAIVLLHVWLHISKGLWSVWRLIFPTDNSSCPPRPILSKSTFLAFSLRSCPVGDDHNLSHLATKGNGHRWSHGNLKVSPKCHISNHSQIPWILSEVSGSFADAPRNSRQRPRLWWWSVWSKAWSQAWVLPREPAWT